MTNSFFIFIRTGIQWKTINYIFTCNYISNQLELFNTLPSVIIQGLGNCSVISKQSLYCQALKFQHKVLFNEMSFKLIFMVI